MLRSRIVHLHVHTQFSLLDGVGKIKDWVEQCKKLGMKELGISDHGNMYGAVDFYTKLKESKIKPIIGQEFYLVNDRTNRDKDIKPTHILVIARNNKGYRNLIKLSSDAWMNGLYYRPRTDLNILKKYKKGLIVTTACFNNDIAKLILNGKINKALKKCKLYKKIFGKYFYLEIQPHNLDGYRKLNLAYVKISKMLNIPLVSTNDCHYPTEKDSRVQDILLLIQTKKTLKDVKEGKDVFQFSTKEFWLKSADEMYDSYKKYHLDLYRHYYKDIVKSIDNTRKIADMCNVKIPLNVPMIPNYGVRDPDKLFRKLCEKGWAHRLYPKMGFRDKDGFWPTSEIYRRQLEKEMKVITDMKLSNYFLIIRDLVHWAKKNDIMVGNARGSVAGSLVAYALGITNIDPIKFGLLFERFLTYDRKGAGNIPDIDLDFQHNRRDEVKHYLEERWGKDKVAAIITFGTMGARSVLKDVGRVFGVDYMEINNVTRQMNQDDTLKDNENFLLRQFQNEHPKLYGIASRLEGQTRHYGVHAAGILIANKPLVKICPMMIHGKDKKLLSQWSMDDTSKRGLLKIDLLGLKTLTILKDTIKLIRERYGKIIKLDEICLIDKKVYGEFCAGNTTGIFQFENRDFQDLLKAIKPSRIEDLAIANALGRPGAKLAHQDEIYMHNKYREGKGIKYVHSSLRDILGRTYGAICFQEQVMQICNQIGNIPMSETNDIREAIKHFDKEVMNSFKKRFIKGAMKNNLNEDQAKGLWASVETHSSYSFNRNHATSYSILGYYTMYFKTYYPKEYMSVLMGYDVGNDEQISKYIRELKRLRIPLWTPSYTHSGINFMIKKKSEIEGILCGFLSIKGIGLKTAEKLMGLRNQHGDKYLNFVTDGLLRKLGMAELKVGIK